IFSYFREGDKFYLRKTNQDRLEIAPFANDKFFVKSGHSTIEFVRDASGKVIGMIWRQVGAEFRTKKIADQPEKDNRVKFVRTENMIPMRDGIKLFTVIITPEYQTEKLPIILERTPYGVNEFSSDSINGDEHYLVADGYIFVFQDIRGRYGSEGDFVMNRP